MPRVEITTAGHTVIIDADSDGVEHLADLAFDLWKKTRDPRIDRAFGTSGFMSERAETGFVSDSVDVPDYGT